MVAENPACRLWRISRRKTLRHPHPISAPCQYPVHAARYDIDAYADTYGGSTPYGGQDGEVEDILHNDWHDYGEGYDDDYFDD